MVHPGQNARLSHGTITTDNLEILISLQYVFRLVNEKPLNMERKCKLNTWQIQELNPYTWRCEANKLTAKS